MKMAIFVLLASVVFPSNPALRASDSARFPNGFRGWRYVKTAVILPGTNPELKSEEGMHHIFANQKAAEAFGSGDFPDGSMIVYELRDTREANGVIVEGGRKRVDVMVKNATLYGNTGGWLFERFWGDDQTRNAISDSGTTCFQCHSKAKSHGAVFSQIQ